MPTISVPRWIQLVGLPVGLLVVWMLAGLLGHVLFLFLTAAVIAFLLNPLVRDLQRMRLPRGLAVALRLPALRGGGDVRRAGARERRRRPDPIGDGHGSTTT